MIKDILRLAAILLVICGIAAACVGTAHDQTAPLIESRKADAVREGYKQVLPTADQLTDEPAEGKHIVAVKRSETDGQTNGLSTQSIRTATAVKSLSCWVSNIPAPASAV